MLRQVYSQIYRAYFVLYRNYFRLFDITIWPITLLFSLTLFVNYVSGTPEIIAMVILGVTGWRAVYHLQFEMITSYMDEYWSHSLNHFLAAPIRVVEFVIGNIIAGFAKFLLVLAVYAALAFSVFGYQLSGAWTIALGLGFLMFFGVVLGLIGLGMVMIFHENAYTAAFIIPDLLVLLSGVYYPITIFPQAVQAFVKYIPAVYGFDMLKSTIGLGTIDLPMLVMTSLAWLLLSVLWLVWAYSHAKKKGKLARMS